MSDEELNKEYEKFSKTVFGSNGCVLIPSSVEGDRWLFIKLSHFFEDVSTIAKNSEVANKKDN